MAAFAGKKNGYKTFGILYNQENAYSVSLLAPFVDRLGRGQHHRGRQHDRCRTALPATPTTRPCCCPWSTPMWTPSTAPTTPSSWLPLKPPLPSWATRARSSPVWTAHPGFNTTYGGDCSNIYYINNINTEDETIAAKIAEIQNDVSAPNKYFLGYDIVMAAADCIAKVGTDYTALHDALENLSYEGVTGKITIDPTTHMPTGMSMYMYTYDNQTPVMLEQFAG